ncbi:uncharacterized protein N7482_001088 [Penicillium canariense]|uniref:DUF6536 domain-containing protein n=1 Tax=Penicillium canariense TaxID=189055 RepID=A0A9W9IJ28_9EURO|nr:uncharacterized protein N7482_001088 [Penicillium canariense]KAJ5175211.1 hypothetical protein N7482_001088 [Penicillium canariense]
MGSRNSIEMNDLADLVPENENVPLLPPPAATTNPAILSPESNSTDEEAADRDDERPVHNDQTCKNRDYVCSRYASKKLLGQYIPEIDEKHVRSKTRKTAASKRSKMLRNQFITTAVICLANIAVLILFWVFFPPDSNGIGTLRMGQCSEITGINSAAHVILNVLSSLYLGAGSYCMQILVAPSRQEIDTAHTRGVSLDIGIQSLRNLRWINRRRIFQWVGIGLLSICMHLL